MDPRSVAERIEKDAKLPPGEGDRLFGYAVYALPFTTGDVLALRRFPVSSFGPAYTAVWHRDPDGRWMHYADQPDEVTCPRFFGRAFHESRQARIRLDWRSATQLDVRVEDRIRWSVTLASTPATRAMSVMGRWMPESWGRSRALLAPMSRAARPMLRAGRMRLAGRVPNGQWFLANPVEMWRVASSQARVGERVLDQPAPLPQQEHLRDFWLVQRGLFGSVRLVFEPHDRARHAPAAATASLPAAG
ncbi:MAG: hypothetical protein QOE90_1111 [Thermoplasmata archaeon]|jgi:hypothetical protein|nr:hypothetical protein [Thermoplasmata archaeon]